MKRTQSSLTPEQAYPKLAHFCAYQERCHKEVLQKLHDVGVYGRDAENIVARLIEENYLNEERFACLFAGGRFRMKQWGKVKISYELKQRGVSAYCIRKALREIPDDDYLTTLQTLIEKKRATLPGNNLPLIRKKLTAFLHQKGYEHSVFQPLLEQLSRKGKK